MTAETLDSEHSTDDLDAARALGRSMSKIMHTFARIKSRTPPVDGKIDWTAFPILRTLADHGSRRSSAIAEAVMLDPSRVSRMIAHLVERGLVERRADPVDGRATIVQITDAGRDVDRALCLQREQTLAEIVSDWDRSDVAALAGLLDRLADDLSTFHCQSAAKSHHPIASTRENV